MPSPNQTTQSKQDSELLFKGVICALIGLVILIGPHFARSPDMAEILRQAYLPGWFALVLGCAFLIRYGLNRWRAQRLG
ncbi:hypothetical protein [Ottowia thiooxydans]|uniref:hypothetical protein n=1 Tax=Ottowia thiooxydans TaxID=219182 RepID=UPI000491D210|nr:hypothetical protein [Ottowia thiooxydans]